MAVVRYPAGNGAGRDLQFIAGRDPRGNWTCGPGLGVYLEREDSPIEGARYAFVIAETYETAAVALKYIEVDCPMT